MLGYWQHCLKNARFMVVMDNVSPGLFSLDDTLEGHLLPLQVG